VRTEDRGRRIGVEPPGLLKGSEQGEREIGNEDGGEPNPAPWNQDGETDDRQETEDEEAGDGMTRSERVRRDEPRPRIPLPGPERLLEQPAQRRLIKVPDLNRRIEPYPLPGTGQTSA
jgi:hypothetical protein